MVLDKRAAHLLFFGSSWDEIIEICLPLWIVEMVGNGVRAVIAEVVNVLARDGVDPVSVQVAVGHCADVGWEVGGLYGCRKTTEGELRLCWSEEREDDLAMPLLGNTVMVRYILVTGPEGLDPIYAMQVLSGGQVLLLSCQWLPYQFDIGL